MDSAFAYQSATIAAKDSLFSQEKAREIQSLGYEETVRQQQLLDAKAEAQTQLKFNMLFGGLGTLTARGLFALSKQPAKAKRQYAADAAKDKSGKHLAGIENDAGATGPIRKAGLVG
ncbi:MAG: hypothetical protein WKG06_26845 [Segetibacter sp.]